MTRIISSLAEISEGYDVLFCDLWGCLHNGKTPFPAAVQALRDFRAKGGVVLLLTNSPRPKPSVIKQLDHIGVPHDCYDELVSSGDAAQYALITGAAGRRVHHLGPEKDRVFFTELSDDLQTLAANEPPISLVSLAEAEGIVCTGLFDDRTETPENYRDVLRDAKSRNLPLLCANPDIIVDYGHIRLFCAGAIAQAYDALGGESLYFGKPHPPIYALARRRLSAMPQVQNSPRILAVGDGIHTDVLGAAGEGIDVIFVTGGIAATEFGADVDNPDRHLLLSWLQERQLSATYSIGQLR